MTDQDNPTTPGDAGTGDAEKVVRLFGEVGRLMMCGHRPVSRVQHAPQRIPCIPQ